MKILIQKFIPKLKNHFIQIASKRKPKGIIKHKLRKVMFF